MKSGHAPGEVAKKKAKGTLLPKFWVTFTVHWFLMAEMHVCYNLGKRAY